MARWAAKVARAPWKALRPVHLQSIMIIQPVDMMADGRTSMCDGCPDMTVHDGQLAWSCRLEEQLLFGRSLRAVPRAGSPAAEAAAEEEKTAAPVS